MKSKSNSTVVKSDNIKSDESASKSKKSSLVKRIVDFITKHEVKLIKIEVGSGIMVAIGWIIAGLITIGLGK